MARRKHHSPCVRVACRDFVRERNRQSDQLKKASFCVSYPRHWVKARGFVEASPAIPGGQSVSWEKYLTDEETAKRIAYEIGVKVPSYLRGEIVVRAVG
jgi:hypothetical protein